MRISPRPVHPCLLLALLLAMPPILGCSGSKENQDKNESTKSTQQNDDPQAADDKTQSQQTDDRKHPRVNIETSLGNIVVQLDAEKTPLTANNFLRYVNEGFYNDTLIHQVRPGYAIVAGTYDENLAAKPTHETIYNEARNGSKNVRGTIAMARESDKIDSATSAFFINLADNSALDHAGEKPEQYGYCVFGKVVEGMDVVERISNVKAHQTADKDNVSLEECPVEPVIIRSMRLVQ